MQDIEKQIKEIAKKLLDEEKVDLIIGYEQGTLPLRARPAFIRESADVERLVWNSSCENNLANYLKTVSGKVGIVTKGCDARAVVGFIKEKQIERDNILILGVPCSGMIGGKKVEEALNGRELAEGIESDSQIILRGEGFEETLEKDKLLHQSCENCKHRNPAISDILIGENIQEQEIDEYSDVNEFASKSADERWAYFSEEASKCIRCYACRNACPACYCPVCFVDQTFPNWFSKTSNPSDTLIFHIVRTLHTAGRCVDCGACSRVCPMNVEIRRLGKNVEKDIKELYGYEVGIDVDEVPPLATFDPDDPQEFIKK